MAQKVKNLPAMQETRVRSLHREDLLEEGMAPHSSILAQKNPGTEKPGRENTVCELAESDSTEQLTLSLFSEKLTIIQNNFLKNIFWDYFSNI